MADKACTLLIHYDKNEPPQLNEIKKQLEKGTVNEKVEAMKNVILLMLNGEPLPQVLMTVIRFVMPVDEHSLKKLLLLYWEIVDKTTPDGKLMQEFILVCNGLRNDLTHPNEYVRGVTLRFLTKMKEPEILDPLLPSVKLALDDKHAYVRRNAVLALYNIYKNFDYLCPDAPDLIYNFLLSEGDATCKRNAFIMLFNTAQDKAVQYLSEVLDQVSSMGEILQFIVVELIRKVCRTTPSERSKYIKCIFTLLASHSSAVQFESATTLLSLSSAPTAVKAATSTLIELLVKESDNNVKMIILDRLITIKKNHPKILQELLMDILRALGSPNMDIRQKTLDIAMDMITPKNVDEVIMFLKKEITKTQSKEFEKGAEYRQILIHAIHQCAVKFPDIASNVVHVLMDFLGDSNTGSAVDVILFVREVVEMYSDLRPSILRKLLESLNQIKSSKVYRSALWIIGEYTVEPDDIDYVFTTLRESLGDLPLVPAEDDDDDQQSQQQQQQQPTKDSKKEAQQDTTSKKTTTKVLSDNTYATQSAFTEVSKSTSLVNASINPNTPHLRALLLGGDFFLGSVLGNTLTKLSLKSQEHDIDKVTKNLIITEVLLIVSNIIHLGQSRIPPHPIDTDSYERLVLCIRILTDPDPFIRDILLKECHVSFARLLSDQQKAKPVEIKKKEVGVQADDLIKVRLLRTKRTFGMEDMDDIDENDIARVIGSEDKKDDISNKLNRVYQLTGFSDPLYSEAYISVHQYDILLDVMVINQTSETLQNVTLELATLGDLKLVERPQTLTIAPNNKKHIKANIKVSSTETGIIFGNIVYDIAGLATSDKNCVVLNDIHIDIMDYIAPATCSEIKFRAMWAEFEWENKVAVHTNVTDVGDFLRYVMNTTNMNCLTPESALSGECGFLSANLYARSVFGEDALANVSIEKQQDGKIGGYIRIRSKTQGIALSLGDKISMKQRLFGTEPNSNSNSNSNSSSSSSIANNASAPRSD